MDSSPGPIATNGPWSHYAIVLLVFSITGITSVLIGRLLINGLLELRGGLWSGPWSYRAAYLLVVTPAYSLTLVAVGSLFGKHDYFKRRVLGTWSRLIPRWMLERLPSALKRGAR